MTTSTVATAISLPPTPYFRKAYLPVRYWLTFPPTVAGRGIAAEHDCAETGGATSEPRRPPTIDLIPTAGGRRQSVQAPAPIHTAARRFLRSAAAAMMIKGTVVVYSIPACPHCRTAKATLAQRGLQYVDVDLERYPHLRPWLREATGKTSVPQIFFNSRHIGGNSELQVLVSRRTDSGGSGVETGRISRSLYHLGSFSAARYPIICATKVTGR